ncbi:unnamed protein product [Trifolium pratense]|uniref:Uncharacterized protein n=1 Tax=Trifolium pratense TaxID=57577 RepID=A0ACB0L8E8_TRIPR|nr:unnamed protein product [Trifolium pratense]
MSIVLFSFPVAAVTAPNFYAQINSIPMLNGMNFKSWKESVEIVLGCMDLDLSLREERPVATAENVNATKIEKWDRSNRMCLMMIKKSIPEMMRGSIAESENAKKFLEAVEKFFAKNDKVETSSILSKLISMSYKGKGNIREYIMEMSNLASKLKALKLELPDDLIVHLVLISLPAHFGQFKVSYNTQKDKWSLNELISHCVQEEERLKREKTESAHLVTGSQNKRKKAAGNFSKNKKAKEQHKESTCFFCKKAGHMKKDCSKYAAWREKKGNFFTFVCSEINLVSVPKDTWWVDSGATTHISMSMQGCLWSRPPSDAERFIYVGDDNKVAVEAIGTFRLLLKTGFHLDLLETFVAPSIRRNLISISMLDKFGYACSFRNNKFSLSYDSNVVGYGSLNDNLYMLDIECPYNEIMQIESHGTKRKLNENSATLWHK